MAEANADEPRKAEFTVIATTVEPETWHVFVVELPETWTVAFARDDIERRAREQIARDTGREAESFMIQVQLSALHLERRSHRRSG